MSDATQAPAVVTPFGPSPPVERPADQHTRWSRVEAALERTSEWLNPILVKEARQALKSRQFVVTFSLLLICGWGWSMLGVALLSPGVYYAPGGRTMLTGYICILLVPMLIIVPFSAFRSLAAEREDGTFELLSITSLNARQIVTGKLGSAILQMAVYYSALGPCMAFTYLLRGIDLLTISLLLSYAFLASTLLSAAGLLVATISRSRQWQVLLSVALVIALVAADLIGSYVAVAMVWAGAQLEYDKSYFWMIHLAVLSFYVSYLALFVFGAAAQISFASDNRSTRLRWILAGQQLLWIFWMIHLWLDTRDNDALYAIVPCGALHWYAIGSLMTGESGKLSPRVCRTLPQSFLGRMFGTWLNPGAGTGYIFTVVNVWVLAIATAIAFIAGSAVGFTGGDGDRLITMSAMAAAYVTIYLGAGRLLMLLLQQVVPTGLILPLLLHILLAALGAIAPAILGGWIQGFNNLDYTELQLTNWMWSLIEAAEGNIWSTPLVPLALFMVAGMVLLVNLIVAAREVEQVRAQTPQRVVEDEQLLHPPPEVPKPRRSPWDDDEVPVG